METFFDTRPVDLTRAIEIAAIGMALFGILEMEKAIRRRLAASPRPPGGA